MNKSLIPFESGTDIFSDLIEGFKIQSKQLFLTNLKQYGITDISKIPENDIYDIDLNFIGQEFKEWIKYCNSKGYKPI